MPAAPPCPMPGRAYMNCALHLDEHTAPHQRNQLIGSRVRSGDFGRLGTVPTSSGTRPTPCTSITAGRCAAGPTPTRPGWPPCSRTTPAPRRSSMTRSVRCHLLRSRHRRGHRGCQAFTRSSGPRRDPRALPARFVRLPHLQLPTLRKVRHDLRQGRNLLPNVTTVILLSDLTQRPRNPQCRHTRDSGGMRPLSGEILHFSESSTTTLFEPHIAVTAGEKAPASVIVRRNRASSTRARPGKYFSRFTEHVVEGCDVAADQHVGARHRRARSACSAPAVARRLGDPPPLGPVVGSARSRSVAGLRGRC